MARKVIIDCDPGIDDAVALCLALFDRRLEVLAITATEGNVSAHQSTRNVHAIMEQLDPPRLPRIGAASTPDRSSGEDGHAIHGQDGLGNVGLAVAELHHQHASDRVICDIVHEFPEDVTIIALGPLTNIARAISRDPQFASLVGRLIIMGGNVNAPGNVSASAEFNMYCDPMSARAVFRSPTTKTLVPLDVTSQLLLSLDFVDQLPSSITRAGSLLRRILPFAFRSHRQNLGLEGIHLHDAVALMAAVHPELFETEDMVGDVETAGELTMGATVFDRRSVPLSRPNMEVCTGLDVAGLHDCILRGLNESGRLS